MIIEKKYHKENRNSYFIIGDKVKIIFKYLKRFVLAGFLIYVYNLIISNINGNLVIPINIFTMIITIFFDIPGLLALIILKQIGL